jgi:hypothetical protein
MGPWGADLRSAVISAQSPDASMSAIIASATCDWQTPPS